MTDIFQPRTHYKPFEYPWAFDAYQTMRKMRWEPEEAPLAEDIFDWNNRLTDGERSLLTQLFRFFTQGDVDIASAYRDRYMPMFKKPEIAMMFYAFADSEANHIHAYSNLLDTIGMPDTEYKAFHSFKEMQEKHDYLFEARNKGLPKKQAIALDIAIFSAFSEGMQLFSSFAMLMNFQRRGLMKGMSTLVEWSIRDESHHVESMIKIFRTIVEENPAIWTDEFKALIYSACRDMVVLEDHFIDLAFGQYQIDGMTPDEVKQYIRYIADRRLNMLGLKSNYGVDKNPLEWLDWIIGAVTHTNFFEQRPTEYTKGGIEGWGEVKWGEDDATPISHYDIISIKFCPWCAMARHLADSRRVEYSYNVMETAEQKGTAKTEANMTTFPIIYSVTDKGDRRLIGGYEEFKRHMEKGT